jgi:hypothetical protein
MIHIWLFCCAGVSFVTLMLWLVLGRQPRRIRSGTGVSGIFLVLAGLIAAIVFQTRQLEIGDWWHAASFRSGEMIVSSFRIDRVGRNKRYHDASYRVLVFGRVEGQRGVLEAGFSDEHPRTEGYVPLSWRSQPPGTEVALTEGSRIHILHRPGMAKIEGEDVLRCLPGSANPGSGPGRRWWIAGVIADAIIALLIGFYAMYVRKLISQNHHVTP